MRKVHELKIAPEYFDSVESGVKPFEVRLNDRDYKVGDILQLKEWTQSGYTGRETVKIVTYIMDDSNYCPDGYMILGLDREGTGSDGCNEDEERQILTCPLPDDEQEILVTNGKSVWQDTFMSDGEQCWLDDSGNELVTQVKAWQPLPEPYRGVIPWQEDV